MHATIKEILVELAAEPDAIYRSGILATREGGAGDGFVSIYRIWVT